MPEHLAKLDVQEAAAVEAVMAVAAERFELRERVEALVDANTQLVRRAAHALRTPLATIGVAASALAQPALPDSTSRLLLTQIDKAVDELRPVLARLLRLAELELTALASEARVDLGELVRGVAASVLAPSDFSIEEDDNGVHAIADPDVVSEILGPVLEAAAHGASEPLSVRVEACATEAVIAVTAAQPGLPSVAGPIELLAFGPPLSETDRADAGLELATSRRLAELSGGRLAARIEPSQRLCFVLGLPRATDR